jgi:acyl-CoA dehydrogenase
VKRLIYGEEHEELRKMALRFFRDEAIPNVEAWEASGVVDRDLFEKAGSLGLLGFQAPVEWGGAGCNSFSYNAVVSEAALASGFVNLGMRLHADIVLPYILRYGDDGQKKRWLTEMVAGRKIGALAISEPGTGSDIAGITTQARWTGSEYVLSGSKTFISNGLNADVVIVIARTSVREDRRSGLSAFVVERGMKGFARGEPLSKMGLRYSDTAELFFDSVQLPIENRLGEEGMAFEYLTSNLPQERLSISVGAIAMARAALDLTLGYAKDRKVFEKELASFQNTKFVLAESATEIEAAEQLLDRGISEWDSRELTAADAAKVKLFCSEVQGRVIDKCLQIFGGYGYLREYRIADMFTDARVTRIYGGSSEVMKVIIAKSLGL